MDNMISKKTIIVKENWLIIKNIHIAIYQCRNKVTELDIFKWLESIAGLFYL